MRLGRDPGLQRLEHRQRLNVAEVLLHVADRGQDGGKRAFGDLDLLERDVDVVHRGALAKAQAGRGSNPES